MEIRQLITFQKVAELGSFSRAAEKLGYSQSAVTLQIKALEEEYGLLLFERFNKKVKITSKGQIFLRYAENILGQIKTLENTVTDSDFDEHILHIGTLDSLCAFSLSEILKIMRKNKPEYRIKISKGSPSELISLMEKNEVDIIYILDVLRYDTKWKRVLQKEEPCLFVCGPDNPVLKKKNISLTELLKYPFYLTEAKDNYQYALAQQLAFNDLSVDPVLEVGDTEVISHMLYEGDAVSFLPRFAVEKHLKEGDLKLVPTDDLNINMYHQIIYHKNKWLTDEMLEFIKTAEEYLK